MEGSFKRRLSVAAATAALLISLAGSALVTQSRDDERLTVDQARVYLLELINRDRAALGRKPIRMDAVAEKMAQSQSDQMAKLAIMSHADENGRLPMQRYTEMGGRDRVAENVVCFNVRSEAIDPLTLQPAPTFTRSEIEECEAAYFNEVPPNDGHRANVLRPEHTHVGIGFARTGDGRVVGNAEEFVDRYVDELDDLPRQAAVGQTITVSGRLGAGRRLEEIDIARGPLPRPLTRSQMQSVAHYTIPAPFARYWPDSPGDGVMITARADGRFRAELKLSDEGRDGLYYIGIKVRDPSRGIVVASMRTILVRAAEKAKGE